ncbi:DMT family transporter [Arhodomonas aquaeolei]|uniref:DMT family transporter n=1 Tax=Arhodomonas aquaeolei TaxID=2369 RepID=UPI00037E529B|nr:DMT family transporter [Arhodomonas aquaeolei]
MVDQGERQAVWRVAMPALFVVLWSTGFIGARLGLPHAEPFTFLTTRMLAASVLLAAVAVITRAPWPDTARGTGHIVVAGLLVHGGYLGGVFWAIGHGLAAGVTAIIVSLQPVLTAALAGLVLGERVTARQWAGLLLGLAGVVLVVSSRIEGATASAVSLGGAVLALLSITFGTLYQKRFCPATDLRTGGAIQFGACAVALFLPALALETRAIDWTGEFVFALAWLVLVLSVGAVGLLFALIRHGAAAKVASLFYLAPPFTVILGYLLFDERLAPRAIAGLAVVMAGVALVNTGGRRLSRRRGASAKESR